MTDKRRRLVLALEPAIEGGSISIIEGQKVLDFERGVPGVSKSDDILLLIETILRRNGIKKESLGLIVVSDEPGSITGGRIGIATGQGIADAVGADHLKFSVFEALLFEAGFKESALAAVFDKDKGVYFKEFGADGSETGETARAVRHKKLFEFKRLLEEERLLEKDWVFTENLSAALIGCGFDFEGRKLREGYLGKGALSDLIGLAGEKIWLEERR
jgi:tRNA A37 threonylcarbamoyladenosine modification protein TsaB